MAQLKCIGQQLPDVDQVNFYAGISKFFNAEPIDEIWTSYETLRETTITESYGDLDKDEKWMLYDFLQRIAKLIEATQLLYKSYDRKAQQLSHDELAVDRILSDLKRSAFEKALDIIKVIARPERIYHLKNCNDSDRLTPPFDFLVLLNGENECYRELHRRIDAACAGTGSVLITFGKVGEVCKYLQQGHSFFSLVCIPDNLQYEKEGSILNMPESINVEKVTDQARCRFAAEHEKAQSFLEGAKYYESQKKYNIAVFHLHQVAEHALRSLLIGIMGTAPFGHNLRMLLGRVCRFTNKPNDILLQDTETNSTLFNLLNRSYAQSRYGQNFSVTADQAKQLTGKVSLLSLATKQAFEDHSQLFKQKFSLL